MMHAKIFEMPGECRTGSDEKLAECVKHLSSADKAYFRRRAVQEKDAAASASCSEARCAHEELAAAYLQLCRSNGEPADPHLASELVMFRFNPRPAD